MRAQTLFSELCVGIAIAGLNHLDDTWLGHIGNADRTDADIYMSHLGERLKTSTGTRSVAALAQAGSEIRSWLRSQSIPKYSVIWTGKSSAGSIATVAKDLEITPINWRVSVKENANVFINGSPVTIFKNLPSTGGIGGKAKSEDWFTTVAPDELNDYFIACGGEKRTGYKTVFDYYASADKAARKAFGKHVSGLMKAEDIRALKTYAIFCEKVSSGSAKVFNANLAATLRSKKGLHALKAIFYYFFKLNSVQYILAGTEKGDPFAVVMLPGNTLEERFDFLDIKAKPKKAGQPEVLLEFTFKEKATKQIFPISIKVEVRWSHGKFCGNPEAKVYKLWSYAELPWSQPIP